MFSARAGGVSPSLRGGHKFTVGTAQFSLFRAESHPVVAELHDVDVDELKPLDALQLLAKWKTLV